ncbi:unnamed protein product [Pleuronectes platessa]|uniref:Uncharacterized protein n=1 Tax=Pleuronectes platessa TaxID=8262 RepID=A0A9N7TUN6_PLEPL|nr:unnamed protein product [Pleuronectes platessa]
MTDCSGRQQLQKTESSAPLVGVDSSWDSTVTCSNEYWQSATPAVGLLQGAAVPCGALLAERDTNPSDSEEPERRPPARFTSTGKQLWEQNPRGFDTSRRAPGVIQTHPAERNASHNPTHVNYNKPNLCVEVPLYPGTNLATPGGRPQNWQPTGTR